MHCTRWKEEKIPFVVCRTNLDLRPGEIWPESLDSRPMVGDIIQSALKRKDGVQLELEVCRVTWKYVPDAWIANVELKMVSGRFEGISAFHEWYSKICR